MDVKLILIILLGVALHLAKTIEQMHQYIGELERDMRLANIKLMEHYDVAHYYGITLPAAQPPRRRLHH